MKEYCLNYKILVGIDWIQVCDMIIAHDDAEAVQYAIHRMKGFRVKDKFLIPYERMVKV